MLSKLNTNKQKMRDFSITITVNCKILIIYYTSTSISIFENYMNICSCIIQVFSYIHSNLLYYYRPIVVKSNEELSIQK